MINKQDYLNTDVDTEDLDIKSQLYEKGIYYITGELLTDALLEIHQDILLKHLNKNWQQDIQLIINSIGGHAAEGWALIDLLDFIDLDVSTVGLGYCASLGACLLACGTKGKRIVAPNTTIMIHGAFGEIIGNKRQLDNYMKDINIEHRKDIEFWKRHSNIKTDKEIEAIFLNGQDNFFSAQEALKLGIVDKILTNKQKDTICNKKIKKKK